MKNALNQALRDWILAWRNGHVAVVLAIMVLMWLLIFFLPTELELSNPVAILDASHGASVRRAAAETGMDGQMFAQDQADYDARMAADPNILGVSVRGTPDALSVTIEAGAHVPPASVAALRASMDAIIRLARGQTDGTEMEAVVLRPGSRRAPLSLTGVPVFLVFEAGILGFLLVAVFVFQEKQEGTLRAYRAAPGGGAPYVAAKLAVFVGLSLAYGGGVLAAAALKGARPDWFGALGTLALSSAFMTLLGLGFATFFRNLSGWFFPGLGILLLNMAPFFSYARPSFNPAWIKAIPSYDALFLIRDYVLNPGTGSDAAAPLLRILAWTALAAVFCALAVRLRLLKE
ncbi:MAG: ABC transporter permease [Spirochaetia bacterium]|nr:ABC transporter permease [Spirochaetia bacterium]